MISVACRVAKSPAYLEGDDEHSKKWGRLPFRLVRDRKEVASQLKVKHTRQTPERDVKRFRGCISSSRRQEGGALPKSLYPARCAAAKVLLCILFARLDALIGRTQWRTMVCDLPLPACPPFGQ